jgi:RNA polymerase sigma-70 factor (ECF subfamily)
MSEPSDTELVERIAAGDRRALGTLYDRHAGLLLGVALRVVPVRAEAEDLVHDVFVEVWQKAHTYDESRGAVRRWLLVRLRSRAVDRLRSHAWSRRKSLDADARPAPENAEVELDASRIATLLDALSEEQRSVVVSGYFDGLSSSEIASSLGIPIGTVKSRMAAALSRMRALLEEAP